MFIWSITIYFFKKHIDWLMKTKCNLWLKSNKINSVSLYSKMFPIYINISTFTSVRPSVSVGPRHAGRPPRNLSRYFINQLSDHSFGAKLLVKEWQKSKKKSKTFYMMKKNIHCLIESCLGFNPPLDFTSADPSKNNTKVELFIRQILKIIVSELCLIMYKRVIHRN